MSTTNRIPEKPNSFKTVITDEATDKTLAEWFSLNQRTDSERQDIANDIYAVMTAKSEAA